MTFSVKLNRFRIFEAPTSVEIRPITLLTGGNSSGKSSFLSALRYLADISAYGSSSASFNKDPFYLGAYDQIAHHRGGRYGRAGEFCLGYTGRPAPERIVGRGEKISQVSFNLTFRKRFGQPTLSKISLLADDHSLLMEFDEDWKSISVDAIYNGESLRGVAEVGRLASPERLTLEPAFFSYLIDQALRKGDSEAGDIPTTALKAHYLGEILRSALSAVPDASFVGAPVRTRPARTYDPSDTATQAEGGHVPSQLAQLARTNQREWERIRGALRRFGRESSLFSDIEIRTLGKSESDPFQLYVTINGPKRNIIDVGYGVSQSIPFIFEMVRRPQNSLYLLQQPEVHLHPEAQAALGSFLVEESARAKGYMVIETHSDFLIDRVRRHVRDGQIKSEDVSLIYFNRDEFSTEVKRIEISSDGDIVDAPENYRDFFIREQFSNLGFDVES